MSKSEARREIGGRKDVSIMILTWIPTLLLTIVMLSIFVYIMLEYKVQIRYPQNIFQFFLHQLIELYNAAIPATSTLLNISIMSILLTIFSWKLMAYSIIVLLILSTGGCMILASLGMIEYISMLNVLIFWFKLFLVYISYLFDLLIRWAHALTLQLIILTIISSGLALLTVCIDERSMRRGGRRIQEKHILRYALSGGGVGIIIGICIFKHELGDTLFLLKIILATFSTLYILIIGS